MKPDTIEWYRAAQQSVAALRQAQPMSSEVRADLDDEEQIIAALITDSRVDQSRANDWDCQCEQCCRAAEQDQD
jgi:hypothetical protein